MTQVLPGSGSPVWVGVGAGAAGGATYALLVVVGTALEPAAYGSFSLFWTAAVVVSLGLFLATEQVAARRLVGAHDAAGRAAVLRRVVRWGAVVSTATAAAGVVWVLVAPGFAGARGEASVAVVVAAGTFVVQFVARGSLAAQGNLRGYAAVLTTDALVRLAGALVLWVVGVRSAGPYMLAVACGAALAAVVGVVAVRGRHAPAWRGGPSRAAAPDAVERDLARLTVAMLAMQLMLNSPVVVAGASGDVELAGRLLAVYTLARLPVFVAQAAQAGYVARVARAAHEGDEAVVRRLVRVVLGAAAAVGAADVVLCAWLAPSVVRVVFGAEYVIDPSTAALAAAGVGVYLLASVANDLVAALGGRHHGIVWSVAVAVAALTALAAPTPTTRTTLPLVVGSAVAAAALVRMCVVRARRPVPVAGRTVIEGGTR